MVGKKRKKLKYLTKYPNHKASHSQLKHVTYLQNVPCKAAITFDKQLIFVFQNAHQIVILKKEAK